MASMDNVDNMDKGTKMGNRANKVNVNNRANMDSMANRASMDKVYTDNKANMNMADVDNSQHGEQTQHE